MNTGGHARLRTTSVPQLNQLDKVADSAPLFFMRSAPARIVRINSLSLVGPIRSSRFF
jgi:hypothetical protein